MNATIVFDGIIDGNTVTLLSNDTIIINDIPHKLIKELLNKQKTI